MKTGAAKLVPAVFYPDELPEIFEKDRPKYVSLITQDGRQIIAKNNSQTKLKERFEQIIHTLKNSSLQPGIYFYLQQNAIKGNPEVFKFPVQVGSPELSEPEKVETMSKIDQIWTPAEALKILSENNRLKLENDFLTKQVDELTKEIEDLENELTDLQTLSEPAANPMAPLMELAIPLLAKYLNKEETRPQTPGAGQADEAGAR